MAGKMGIQDFETETELLRNNYMCEALLENGEKSDPNCQKSNAREILG